MAKIRSSDALVGVLIGEETVSWGTAPATWTINSTCYQVPIISCDIKVVDEILPDSGEFTQLGAAQQAIRGRRTAAGSITFEPTYNGEWMWNLFGQGFGNEDLELDKTHEEAAEVGLNTHVFNVAGVTPKGMSILIYKGQGTSDYSEEYNGLICTSWTWTHPVGSRPSVTMNFVGKAAANPVAAISSRDITSLAGAVASNRVLAGDLDSSRANASIFFGGGTMANLNITSFTITGDRSVGASENEFLQNILTVSKPGQLENRNVTLDIEGILENDYAAAEKPMTEYLADTLGCATIDYCSSVTASGTVKYQIAFDMPSLNWIEATGDLSQTGEIPFRARARCLSGALTRLDSPFNAYAAYPASASTDLRVRMHCLATDEPGAGDTRFTQLVASS